MEPGPLPADPSHGAPNGADALLICGLGALGQACLERLLGFAVPLTGVDLHQPVWRSPELERAFQDRLILGDMRQAAVLQRAGVEHCRAVLLLSQDSQVNLEAALQVRLLNPDAELVVRAGGQEQSLGHLLEQRLPRLAVVNPLMLTAAALALGAGVAARGPGAHGDAQPLRFGISAAQSAAGARWRAGLAAQQHHR